ncbi:MAG: NAD(P)H-dependent oxidoreductase subunit E [Nitrososphaeria archaeon]|nr:NAD(P)H-dependent oxidoreductase subunit E [Nitrososphaeria archaeon]
MTTSATSLDKRLILVDKTIAVHGNRRDALLEILHTAHNVYGFLDKKILLHISEKLRIPPSQVYGVATFYNYFKLKKPGSHSVTFCLGTACYVKGVEEILSALEKEFNVKRGETSSDGKLSLFVTRCVGACAMAPNVIVDDEMIGKATKEVVLERIRKILESERVEA